MTTIEQKTDVLTEAIYTVLRKYILNTQLDCIVEEVADAVRDSGWINRDYD